MTSHLAVEGDWVVGITTIVAVILGTWMTAWLASRHAAKTERSVRRRNAYVRLRGARFTVEPAYDSRNQFSTVMNAWENPEEGDEVWRRALDEFLRADAALSEAKIRVQEALVDVELCFEIDLETQTLIEKVRAARPRKPGRPTALQPAQRTAWIDEERRACRQSVRDELLVPLDQIAGRLRGHLDDD